MFLASPVALLARRSLVFRLWLAAGAISIAVSAAAVLVYTWSTIEDDLSQEQEQIELRQETMGVLAQMTGRFLATGRLVEFGAGDFELLRSLDVHRLEFLSPAGEPMLRIDPHAGAMLITPAFLDFLARLGGDAEALEASGRAIVVQSLPAPPFSSGFLSTLQEQGEIRHNVTIGNDGGGLTIEEAAELSTWEVIKGGNFANESWAVSPMGLIQRNVLLYPDLTGNVRATLFESIGILIVIAALSLAGWWLLLRRLVYRPLTQYSDYAQRIAAGETVRMPASGHDEMSGLAHAINGMADVLENRAAVDSLTGLYNLRHLSDHMESLIDEALRSGQPFSILMTDLDHFKPINDTYGHAAGDRLLQVIANVIHRFCDGRFVAWRLGGDEFVVALPGVGRAEAERLARQLEGMVGALQVRVADGVVRPSMSVGVATLSGEGENVGALLGIADRVMYRRKAERHAEPQVELLNA